MKPAGRTTFSIHLSSLLFFLLIFIYAGASGCVFLLPFHPLWKLIMMFFCMGAFVYQCRRYIFFQHKNSYIKLTYDGKEKWYLQNNYHQEQEIVALLQKSSVAWSHVMLLHFREEVSRRFYSVLIFCDAMTCKDFHMLKIVVRTAK